MLYRDLEYKLKIIFEAEIGTVSLRQLETFTVKMGVPR